MPELLACEEKSHGKGLPVVVDVGAAIHGQAATDSILEKQSNVYERNGRPGVHSDDSDALLLLGAFGNRAVVHAFEPQLSGARRIELSLIHI